MSIIIISFGVIFTFLKSAIPSCNQHRGLKDFIEYFVEIKRVREKVRIPISSPTLITHTQKSGTNNTRESTSCSIVQTT